MPWIDAPHESEWPEEMDELRREAADPGNGRVDWIIRVHALDAGSMRSHFDLYRQAMKGTATLRKVEREMLAVVISQINECHY